MQSVLMAASLSGAAAAQTTLTLRAADATLQGGSYQDRNFGSTDLVTRASSDPTWIRRALLKFDTHTTIPAGSPINSARLTVTVKGGGTETRTIAAYCVPESFDEHQTTWRLRKGTLYWREAGGTTNHRHATATVTGTAGASVTFDVTAIAREAMATSSRYTRVLLVDAGSGSKGSLRYYHSNESTSTSLRPKLTVSYGASTSTSGSGTSSALSLAAADATLRGGSYRHTNYGSTDLVTRASGDDTWTRHALLKFDTHTTIPAGSAINSARLTVYVKGGNSETRTVAAYCVPESFDEHQTTWTLRKGTLYWDEAGGTTNHRHATATVGATAGTAVTFDVTAVTREAMATSSRYTRVLLVDIGAASKGSLRYYHSNESASASMRPKLVVSYGDGSTTSTPETSDPATSGSSTSSTTLKVLEWNIHQGYGTDGRNNIDRVVNWIVKLGPQVIAFNEIMKYSTSNQPQQIADKLKARTGQTWYYHWAQKWGATSGEGVAVLSRYPFADTDTDLLSYDRSVALVRVVVNGRIVNFAATHLDHQYSSRRLVQVRELKSYLSMFAQQRITAGDFNSWPGTTEINEMAKDYYDAWAVAKSRGTASSYAGNEDGATRNTRIDYVFYSKYATLLSLLSVQVPDTRADMVSDHRPVLATFRVN